MATSAREVIGVDLCLDRPPRRSAGFHGLTAERWPFEPCQTRRMDGDGALGVRRFRLRAMAIAAVLGAFACGGCTANQARADVAAAKIKSDAAKGKGLASECRAERSMLTQLFAYYRATKGHAPRSVAELSTLEDWPPSMDRRTLRYWQVDPRSPDGVSARPGVTIPPGCASKTTFGP